MGGDASKLPVESLGTATSAFAQDPASTSSSPSQASNPDADGAGDAPPGAAGGGNDRCSPLLSPSDIVQVFGLEADSSESYVGRFGSVVRCIQETDRYEIDFGPGMAPKQHASFEAANLKKCFASQESPTTPLFIWQFKHYGWRSFAAHLGALAESGYETWCSTPGGDKAGSQISYKHAGNSYVLDFASMSQTNTKTGKRRPVQRTLLSSVPQDAWSSQAEVLLSTLYRKALGDSAASAVEKEILRQQLGKVRAAEESLIEERDQLAAKSQMLEDERNGFALEAATDGQERDKLAAEATDIQLREEQLLAQVDALRREVAELADETSALEAERAELVARAEHLQTELATQSALLQEEQTEHQATMQTLEDERAGFSRSSDQLRRDLQTEQGKHRDAVKMLEEERARLEGNIVEFRNASMLEIEAWRGLHHGSPRRDCLQTSLRTTDPTLNALLKEVLRKVSHPSRDDSRCNPMQNVEVQHVVRIANRQLWAKYTQCSQIMSDEYARRDHQPSPLKPSWEALNDALPWVKLNTSLNEVLLFHGSKHGNSNVIMEMGFDPRVASAGGLYGEGTYLASEACKSMQYTDESPDGGRRCILLCRAILGDPEYVTGPRKREKRPSCRDPRDPLKGLYDCFVVNPGKSGGPPAQDHREFVIFRAEQIYPELAIWFKV